MPKAGVWRVGTRAWLPGREEPFEGGTVTAVQGERVTIKKDSGDTVNAQPDAEECFVANPEGLEAPDHCGMIHLNEPSVLHNSCVRFADDKIYTYVRAAALAPMPPSSARWLPCA